MTSEEVDNLFDNRGSSLVDEPPAMMFEEWNRVFIRNQFERSSKQNIQKRKSFERNLETEFTKTWRPSSFDLYTQTWTKLRLSTTQIKDHGN